MEWTAIVSVIAAISGVVLGWLGRSRTVKQDTVAEVSKDAEMRSSVDYIKRGVDEMRLEQKDQGRRFDALSERVTRVEESTKQAHHRINRLEGRGLNDIEYNDISSRSSGVWDIYDDGFEVKEGGLSRTVYWIAFE